MKIEVTQEDINLGSKLNCSWCPVALAVWHSVGSGPFVSVSRKQVNIDGRSWLLPIKAQKFIDAFDNGEPVVPFTFELRT